MIEEERNGCIESIVYGLTKTSDLRPRYPARSLGPRPRKNRQSFNLLVGHCQFDYSPPSCHDPAPRFANRKTRNPPANHEFHQQIISSMTLVSWNRSSVLCPLSTDRCNYPRR